VNEESEQQNNENLSRFNEKFSPHRAVKASTFNGVDDFSSIAWIPAVFEAVNESIGVEMDGIVKISRFRTNLNGQK
jgi:hypothetical protein